MIYLDTSVLLPGYTPEARSELAERLLRTPGGVTVSDLTIAEFACALVRKVRRGDLTHEQASRVRAALAEDVGAKRIVRTAVQSAHFDRAGELADKFGPLLRTLDALHLVVAAELGIAVATFDDRMAQAARALNIQLVT